MPSFRTPISATRDGRYKVRLGEGERDLVRDLLGELRDLVRRGDGVERLYPVAYRDDTEAAEEFARLVHGDMQKDRLAALDLVARTIDEDTLDHEQAEAWCGALNDLRLVLGERLGVTEDTDMSTLGLLRDPRARELALYGWLTYLQGSVVDALASRL